MNLLSRFFLIGLLLAVTPVLGLEGKFENLPTGRDYYGVYDEQGRKLGYFEQYFHTFNCCDGEFYFVYSSQWEFSMYDGAENIEYLDTIRDKYLFDVTNHFELVQAWEMTSSDSWSTTVGRHGGDHSHHSESSTTLTREGDSFKVISSSMGGKREWFIPAFSLTAYDMSADYSFLRSNPKVGDRVEIKSLNFEKLLVESSFVTIKNIGEMMLDGVKTKRYDGVVEFSDLDGSFQFVGLGSGAIVNATLHGIEIRKEPEKIAKDVTKVVDMFDYALKPLNQSLPEMEDLSSITIEVSGKDVEGMFINSRNQKVEVVDSDHLLITLQNGIGTSKSLQHNDSVKYLEKTPLYPVELPEITELVEKITGHLASEEEKVDRLIAFVDDLIVDEYAADSSDVLEILSTKKGDCTEHTLLFITLSRAAGIPAKEATGYIYNVDSNLPNFGAHAWAEVLIDGYWNPVDPTWGENPASIGHLKMAEFTTPLKQFEIRVIDYRSDQN